MSDIQDDAKLAHEGRKNKLKDTDELQVTAPLREQISDRLLEKLEEKGIGQTVATMWTQGNGDRATRLRRQEEFLVQVDEFIDPIYESSTEWGSTLHLPTILTVCKTFHGRMYAALVGIDPPFTMRSRTSANVDRARKLQDLMRYTLTDYCNDYQGIKEPVDSWLWDWITGGQGVMKQRWNRKFTRFEDIQVDLVPGVGIGTDEEGNITQTQTIEQVESIVMRSEKTFDGPEMYCVSESDVLIVGGHGDPDKADAVLERERLTASELYQLADQGLFRSDAVERIIKSGNSSETGGITDGVRIQQKMSAGETNLDATYDLDRYEIIEAYIKVCVDDSGIDSDVIVWVHPETKEIVRATYLRRAMKSGLRPYAKIGFHRRFGADHDVGMIELLYSLGKEIDAVHNMRIDTGILTSLPWGFYRPTNAFNAERMPISPGDLIPTQDPHRDVFFPNLQGRTSFGMQEEAGLMSTIERFTSLNDINFGQLQGQGAARTATGANLLAGESNANLDIYIQRMNRGWKKALVYLFHLLQQNIPDGLEYRVVGDDGDEFFGQIESKIELQGMYDFELEANSANSNPTLQKQTANQIYQITQNPLDLQLGLVSPMERYEALRGMLISMGVKDISRYVRRPTEIVRQFTPMEIADRLLRGMDVPLDPTQDLDGFIKFVELIMEEDELLGQFSEHDVAALMGKMQEAQGLVQALQQAQNDQQVLRQQDINSSALFGGGLQGRIEADSSQGVL